MTIQKATAQAISELGEIESHNRDAIVRRRDELMTPNVEVTGVPALSARPVDCRVVRRG